MGKYFGSELTSSKADIYNKSSIVRRPDNYSGDGLKQTRACNRHIVALCWSSVLCVNERCKRETQRCLQSKRPAFTGIHWAPTTCWACATAACVLAFTLTPASPLGRCPWPQGKLAGTPVTLNTWPLLPAPHLPPKLATELKYLQSHSCMNPTVMWIFAPYVLSLVNSDSTFKIQFSFYLLRATFPETVNSAPSFAL